MLTDELIARRPSGRKGLADWYSEVFRAQEVEGLSVTDVAAKVGVTPTNIYHWRRRLRGRESVPDRVDSKRSRSGLVRVEVVSGSGVPAVGASGSSFEIRLSSSRSIRVPVGFDAATLQRLVMALETC